MDPNCFCHVLVMDPNCFCHVLDMDPYCFYNSIENSAETDEVRRLVTEKGVAGLSNYVLNKNNEWRNVHISIALVGESAVGKSTFINSIRGLTADDPGAASVGTGDTTQHPTPYPHPHNDHVVFWDLPGVGTAQFPRNNSYLGTVGFFKYDFFILLSDERFSTNDVWLARKIEAMKKDYFFVRTKIDNTMESAKISQQIFSIAEVLQTVHQYCEDNFKAAQLKNRTVYCISNYEQDKWDFSKLLDDILVSLPEIKRNAFVLSLTPLTKGIIKGKSDALRRRAKLFALISGCAGASTSFVPIPLVGGAISLCCDIALLVEEVYFYITQYGLNEESLTQLSKRTDMSLDYYKNALKKGSMLLTSRQGIKSTLMKLMVSESAEAVAKRAAVECVRIIPFVGALVGGLASFGTSLYLLHSIIKDLEEDAMHIADAIIASASSRVDP